MENPKKTTRKLVLFALMLLLAAGSFFSSCSSCNPKGGTTTNPPIDTGIRVEHWVVTSVTAIIRDNWNGQNSTEAGDSLWYYSNGNAYNAATNSNGDADVKDTNYTAGKPIIMEATANGEICGKVFNQALTSITGDGNYEGPTFTINALGGAADTVPVRITVTDMSGTARSGYTVQFQSGGVNYGGPVTTNSSGVANYNKGLAQNASYTVTATGSAGTSSPLTVSTTALTGSGGNGTGGKLFSGIAVYIRY
jgi:hypothetical protein